MDPFFENLAANLKAKNITDEQINDVITGIVETQQAMANNAPQTQNSIPPEVIAKGVAEISTLIREYITIRFKHDNKGYWFISAITIAILITICFLAYWDKIETGTIAALVGSLIGYSIGKMVGNGNGGGKN